MGGGRRMRLALGPLRVEYYSLGCLWGIQISLKMIIVWKIVKTVIQVHVENSPYLCTVFPQIRRLYEHILIEVPCSTPNQNHNTGLQIFFQKCPLFGFWLISTNFGSLIPNPKSVFPYLVGILQCCQFCVFRARKSIFRNFRKFGNFFWKLVTYS